MKKPSPLNGDHNRDPYLKALKRMGFIHHGSTLRLRTQNALAALAIPTNIKPRV